MMKSRSLTASIEFSVTSARPSSRATYAHSSFNVVPASAPEPSGHRNKLSNDNPNR